MSTISRAAEPLVQVRPVGSTVVLSLGALDFGLETSIVLPALPALAWHYGASLVGVGWFAAAFPVVAVAAVPLLGRLGDLVGKRNALLLALMAFATGSILCAITSSIGVAIAGRAIQGVGAAVTPLGLGIVRDTLPRDHVPRAKSRRSEPPAPCAAVAQLPEALAHAQRTERTGKVLFTPGLQTAQAG